VVDAFVIVRPETGNPELVDGTEGLDAPDDITVVCKFWAGDTVDVSDTRRNKGKKEVQTLSRGWLNVATEDGVPLLAENKVWKGRRFNNSRQLVSTDPMEMPLEEVQRILVQWYAAKRHRYSTDEGDVRQIIECFKSSSRTASTSWQEQLWAAYSAEGLFPMQEVVVQPQAAALIQRIYRGHQARQAKQESEPAHSPQASGL